MDRGYAVHALRQAQAVNTVPVRVSTAALRQVFHGCEPQYIADVCKAACCRSSTSPTGTSVALLPVEARAMVARGLVVLDGLLQPRAGERSCPWQAPDGLCQLHETDAKPFGCIASPFVLTKRGCLVVRNRYRLLRCYRDGVLPAYQAFATSLVLLFGPVGAAQLTARLDAGATGQLDAQMLADAHAHLQQLHAVRRPDTGLTLGLQIVDNLA